MTGREKSLTDGNRGHVYGGPHYGPVLGHYLRCIISVDLHNNPERSDYGYYPSLELRILI